MPARLIRLRLPDATIWAALCLLLASSVLAAAYWHVQAERHDRQGVERAAAGIGSGTASELARIDDLMAAIAAQIDHRQVDVAALRRWYARVAPAARLPSTRGVAVLRPTPGSGCAVVAELGSARAALRSLAGAGTHPCAGSRPSAGLREAQLTGQARVISFGRAAAGAAITAFPVFARRRANGSARLRVWVVGVLDARRSITAAARPYPGVSVQLVHSGAPAGSADNGQIRVGEPPDGRVYTVGTPIGTSGRWRFLVTGRGSDRVGPDVQALVVLLGGIALALALFGIMRGRTIALRMVNARTLELQHLATHDALTGLPNRALLLDRAEQMLASAQRDGRLPAAMFIDLDCFKQINDRYGHAIGDDLLRTAAQRITASVRDSDTVGRIGGDEFVVLVTSAASADQVELVAQRILQALREPVAIEGVDEHLTLRGSIGIATGVRSSPKELLRDADLALYEAKAGGRDTYVSHQPGMLDPAAERLAIEVDLRNGLDSGQFSLDYQPLFEVATGKVHGFESLLRWSHPRRGPLTPGDFLAVAEESGLIVDLGRWVLVTACEQAARWREDGHEIRIFVNVSARQLADPGFVDTVRFALDSTGLHARALILEITEHTTLEDPHTIRERLYALRNLGVTATIDDMGSGYSSLAYLRDFPVEGIKIDQSFIAESETSPASRSLVCALIQLGRSLGLRVVAEGIETEAQLELLREEGCELAQGFLLARPMSAEAATPFLAETRDRAAREAPRRG